MHKSFRALLALQIALVYDVKQQKSELLLTASLSLSSISG